MKNFLLFIFTLMGMVAYGQSVKGIVLDGESGEPLIGASVSFVGTTVGTITDIDGSFMLETEDLRDITISYVGYKTKVVNVDAADGDIDLGLINLSSGGVGLEEVVITGTMDIVRDRRTPVAVSTISSSEIQAKVAGNVELPEVAKATPSVFVANQAGGFGDSEVFTRGFDQTNTAFLLNGQPINGMEDGKMYWSNWSGLTDVASAVQIQRGLGASKLAISSVGGTWNFIMKSTETQQGGNVFTTIGNDNFRKVGASYSTGLVDDKWGVTFLLSAWSGDGWAHGTRGQGQTYFLSAGYKPAENHAINFLVTGAPQWHDQKFSASIFAHENNEGEIDPRYNANWGVYDGDYLSERRNFYHKPVMNLNWDWEINDVSSLSTVFYGSLGRGGGTGPIGGSTVRTESGLINFDAMASDPENGYAIRSSMNLHNWFGTVVKYERDLTDNLNLSVGTDLRRYFGDHFRQVTNNFNKSYTQSGVPRYPNGYTLTDEYAADPWESLTTQAPEGERIAYNNAETIRYAGLFGQLEYANDFISTYLQGSVSTQDHVRHELFYELAENEDSEKVINNGYNVKAGISYNINDNNTVFVNGGVYSRQPFHDVIYEGNTNSVNPNTANEDIVGLEVGYKFSNRDFSVNLNGYRTAWNNRIVFSGLEVDQNGNTTLINGDPYTPLGEDPYELLYQDQLHTGVEIDLGFNVTDDLELKGFGSVGVWEVVGDRDVELFDGVDARDKVREYTDEGEDIKVGGAPQTSFGLGAAYDFSRNLKAEANYFYYDNLYARNGGIELPSYGLLDLNISYSLPLSNGDVLRIVGNVYNVLDELYISKSFSSVEADTNEANNWNGINKDNEVTFGMQRTYNLTMKYSF